MKVEGVGALNNYYDLIYNKDNKKVFSGSETDDGFENIYNLEQLKDEKVSAGHTDFEMGSEEMSESPQRKKGTYSQVITLPDGSRYLVTTMYLCGKEIKITKKLPSIDDKNAENDILFQQEEEDDVNEKVMKR